MVAISFSKKKKIFKNYKNKRNRFYIIKLSIVMFLIGNTINLSHSIISFNPLLIPKKKKDNSIRLNIIVVVYCISFWVEVIELFWAS